MRRPLALTLTLLLTPAVAADTCAIAVSALEARITKLEPAYGLALYDISCDAPTVPAHRRMCDNSGHPEIALWRMGRLDDLVWLCAVENATGQEVDPTNPLRDASFLAVRDACTDTVCLCAALIDHTNASLGGTSPYPP